ncbi:GNAT family N-acetyltransferase [Dysgonomonas sp. 25]|uniref:GNAT family N-acetyltransferase n=1 Tax=Dysgonomonas sp. 25 TaxID=2302933 RepID=UPI0013D1E3B9|nr:GNAT family N-acetyltransferase [Dysgonomonas sp. 25]NDV70086.1 GNAT family N-acetyltransferase [Dysgonomonas sp. 25]
MIRFADEHTIADVRHLWKTCFGDTDEFLDIVFGEQYKYEHTLLYFDGGEPVAALHMFPYTLSFHGADVPFYYLGGLGTMPEYRGRGYMGQLIHRSFEVMRERAIPLSILVPAEESLMAYYNRFGFEQVFEKSDTPLPSIKELIDRNETSEKAYQEFDKVFNWQDVTVQKTFDNFLAIVRDAETDGFPDKFNLNGMAKIIDAPYLKDLYRQSTGLAIHEDRDERLLCRLLFGYKIDKLPKQYHLFPQQRPVINLMLE